MTLAVILLCVALICVCAPGAWPFSPHTIALILSVIALLVVVDAWSGLK